MEQGYRNGYSTRCGLFTMNPKASDGTTRSKNMMSIILICVRFQLKTYLVGSADPEAVEN